MSGPALRPFLPADTAEIADVFRLSIEILAAEDYSEAQRAAWMGAADDEAAFGQRLAGGLTLVVAGEEEGVVGFATLTENRRIDLLCTRPDFMRQGVATLLVEALERLAAARGATVLAVDASDTAEPFFRARGYVARQRSTVSIAGEWLANTVMEKPLRAERQGT